ncbi:MAG: type II toxin-antitoxin system RelE/ParE family toxin [Longimicrobiales bacterium]
MVTGSIHPEALEELTQAITYYEERAPGLGREFFDEVHRVMDLIRENPQFGVGLEPPFRRILTPRFPFAILYRRTSRGVRILAVMHQRRKPGYWRGRS